MLGNNVEGGAGIEESFFRHFSVEDEGHCLDYFEKHVETKGEGVQLAGHNGPVGTSKAARTVMDDIAITAVVDRDDDVSQWAAETFHIGEG